MLLYFVQTILMLSSFFSGCVDVETSMYTQFCSHIFEEMLGWVRGSEIVALFLEDLGDAAFSLASVTLMHRHGLVQVGTHFKTWKYTAIQCVRYSVMWGRPLLLLFTVTRQLLWSYYLQRGNEKGKCSHGEKIMQNIWQLGLLRCSVLPFNATWKILSPIWVL